MKGAISLHPTSREDWEEEEEDQRPQIAIGTHSRQRAPILHKGHGQEDDKGVIEGMPERLAG
jgi:hypothetical protein